MRGSIYLSIYPDLKLESVIALSQKWSDNLYYRQVMFGFFSEDNIYVLEEYIRSLYYIDTLCVLRGRDYLNFRVLEKLDIILNKKILFDFTTQNRLRPLDFHLVNWNLDQFWLDCEEAARSAPTIEDILLSAAEVFRRIVKRAEVAKLKEELFEAIRGHRMLFEIYLASENGADIEKFVRSIY